MDWEVGCECGRVKGNPADVERVPRVNECAGLTSQLQSDTAEQIGKARPAQVVKIGTNVKVQH